MKYLLFISSLCLISLLVSCGLKNDSKQPLLPQNNPQIKVPEKTYVLFFGAPECEGCNREIIDAYKRINNEFKDEKSLIKIQVMTENASDEEEMNEWKKAMGIDFEMVFDNACSQYKKYFTQGGCSVPAAVVLSEKTGLIKKFNPDGDHLDEIFALLHDRVK